MINYNKIIHDLLTIDYNDNSQTGKIMKLLSQLRIPVVRCSAQEALYYNAQEEDVVIEAQMI